MNTTIKTLADIHPEAIYTTKKQYKVIKGAKPNKPFTIEDNSISQQLIVIGLIKKERLRVKKERSKDDSDDIDLFPSFEETGKYLLTPEGEYHLDYKKTNNNSKFKSEFRAWTTLLIALSALFISIYSLYLNSITVAVK